MGEGLKNKTVVLFNGAPNTGKDESAKMMQGVLGSGYIDSFKETLYTETAKLFNVDLGWLKEVATDRSTKEKPNKRLVNTHGLNVFMKFVVMLLGLFINKGISPRNALIYTSEKYIKPRFGASYFGRTLAERIVNSEDNIFFIPDSGFPEELYPLIDAGLEVVVVRLHRDGYTFDGDSRNFLSKSLLDELKVRHTDLYNNGTLAELEDKILNLTVDFVLKKGNFIDEQSNKAE